MKFWKLSWKTGKETMIPPTPSLSYIVLKAPAREINQGNKRQNEWERKKYNPSYSDNMTMYTKFRRFHRCGIWITTWSWFTLLFYGYQSYGDYCCLVAKSCPTLSRLYGLQPTRLLWPWDFPGEDTGVACHFLLQGIFSFPTEKSSHISCTGSWILYPWATREDPLFD